MNLHLMLDFETLGTRANTVVLSLGAVVFNREAILQKEHFLIGIDDQIRRGRHITGSTLSWWLTQEKEAQVVIQKAHAEGMSLPDFSARFLHFVQQNNISKKVWANGASFDVPIIENILQTTGAEVPWNFWDVRCYRTMKALFDIEKGRKREGIKHDALDDAIFQAGCVQNYLRGNPERDR